MSACVVPLLEGPESELAVAEDGALELLLPDRERECGEYMVGIFWL